MPEAYAICKQSKCKRPVYTKEQADEQFVFNDNFVVLEDDDRVSIGTDVTTGRRIIPYPEGFTKDNCIILNVMIKGIGYNNYGEYDDFYEATNESQLKDNGIALNFMYESGPHEFSYRIALYRFKD